MPIPGAAALHPGFPDHLRRWRRHRRYSQLELSSRSGISQRHLSFLESGRSRPSREMVLQLSDSLEIPLRDRNDLLVSAGFAPAYQARTLDHPQMEPVLSAVRTMLTHHEPFPALALDRSWTIQIANRAFERLQSLLGDDLWTRVGDGSRNLMRLFFHPRGLRPAVQNWAQVAPLLWHRARCEAELASGGEMKVLLAELARFQDAEVLQPRPGNPLLPVLPLELDLGGRRLSLFSVIATFGTAQDVTTDELRIETLFPADQESDAFLRSIAQA